MSSVNHSKLRTVLMNLGIAASAFLFALVLIECGIRICVGTAILYKYDADILYRPIPNQKGFPSVYYLEQATVNSLGMRGREINPAAKLRFLVVGDSHAFGVGLKDGQTLSAQLEQRFQQKYGPDIAVAN